MVEKSGRYTTGCIVVQFSALQCTPGSIERFNALTSQTVGTGVHPNNGSDSLLKISQLFFMTKARKVGQYWLTGFGVTRKSERKYRGKI